ncbi:hypothetical protein BKH40_07435 [Helicobacter sp. 11S02629-2]|nr:hypothetical protein BKH40_07435 [Helicobacter sp. 11S02629-2]
MIIGCIMFLTGCASLALQPSQISSYDHGIKIYQDSKPSSKFQLEVGQKEIGGIEATPLVLFVTVESKNSANTFDLSNINFYMNDKEVKPLTYTELKKAKLDLSDVAYDYGIYIKPKNANSVMAANKHPLNRSIIYRPHGIHSLSIRYTPYSYAASKQALQAKLNQNAIDKANALIYKSYLKKSTLAEGKTINAKGGFVLIPYRELKSGILKVNVKVGSDSYTTSIKLSKL